MTKLIPIEKFSDQEKPVPTAWRSIFDKIIDAFVDGDFKLDRGIQSVTPLSVKEAIRISENIEDYGDSLVNRTDKTWDTSVYRWMNGYWEVIIDLYVTQGKSDLALLAEVREDGDHFKFEVTSVHVL